jgi:hypothetical protein
VTAFLEIVTWLAFVAGALAVVLFLLGWPR